MYDLMYIIFGSLSVVMAIASVIYSTLFHPVAGAKGKKDGIPLLNRWQACTVGIVIAVALAFVPAVFSQSDDFVSTVSAFVLLFYHTIKLFLMSLELEHIRGIIQNCSENVKEIYTLYMYFVTLCAPIMTAGVILTLFKSFVAEVLFRFGSGRPHYIMSEVNDYSLALAENISNDYKKALEKYKEKPLFKRDFSAKPVKPVIVFAGMDERMDETDNLGAICLSNEIGDIGIGSKREVNFFLIGLDESKNVALALRLTEKYKNRPGISVNVFAESEESGHILDSAEKGNLLVNPEFKELIKTSAAARDDMLSDNEEFWKGVGKTALDGNFTLRRICSSENLALDILQKAGVFGLARQDGYISILIAGMGGIGKAFLKTALWYCQLEGIRLEINVVDKGIVSDSENDLVALLSAEAPEVVKINPSTAEGDAAYDIAFIPDVDCDTVSLDNLFEGSDYSERLARTQLALVALGDDDTNISVAIRLRQLFDRKVKRSNAQVPKFGAVDFPQIYSVVFDDRKAQNLNISAFDKKGRPSGAFIKNYKGQPYFIDFVGGLSTQYSCETLKKIKEREAEAFRQHLSWVAAERRLKTYIREDADFRKTVEDEMAALNMTEIPWGSTYLIDDEDIIDIDSLLGEVELYANFEYYRQASLARALHKQKTAGLFIPDCPGHTDSFICMCEVCLRRRVTEHNRWNAYMRSKGYIRGGAKNDRGRIHQDIKPWDELFILEKFKD